MLFIWHVIKVGYMINNYKERKEWSWGSMGKGKRSRIGKEDKVLR